MVYVSATELRAVTAEVLAAAGADSEAALHVAHSLVMSNVLGHDSHGVRRIPQYLGEVRAGRIDPRATPKTERTRPGALLVHGRWAFGQLAAARAVDDLVPAVAEHGSATAAIGECNHVGRLGESVGALAERGLVGIAFGNADATVAPLGGRARLLGTNPFAWAVPRGDGRPPIVLDWATAGIAEGKLAILRDHGEPVAPGLVLDADGHETTTPADFYAGGALRPFGGHKGYGLSLLIELVGGLLTRTGIGSMPNYAGGFGTVLVALDVASFVPLAWFAEQVEAFCAELASTPRAAGHDEVLVPGEPEERVRAERERDGIPLPERTWDELRSLPRAPVTQHDA